MMRGSQLQDALEQGERLSGFFWPDGVEERTPGILDWSADRGATLELLATGGGWPQELAGKPIAVHGVVQGFRISLLDAWVNRMELMNVPTGMHSSTVALGDHCTSKTVWKRAVYSTANLSEWRADSGIDVGYSRSKRATYFIRARWKPPTRDDVELPDAKLSFSGEMESTGVAYAADWSIETRQTLSVNPTEARTIDQLHRSFAQPLLAFTTFVSDRPDGLTLEVVFDPDSKKRVVVLRQAPRVEPRPWRTDHAYLFSVEALDDYAGSLKRWWQLHEEVFPALGLYGSYVNEGNSYSPARFLTLHTAVEGYARVRHGQQDLKKLRNYAAVPSSVTGCTNDALGLIGVSRNYFAHLGHTGQKYSLRDVEENALESTRRLAALVQSCLMRELGISPAEVEQLLNVHYQNWPIP